MKKTLLYTMLCCLLMLPMYLKAQSTVDAGQSTEGKDFWVTFLQADQRTSSSGDLGSYNSLHLSLSISSRKNCQVTISNPFTDYKETVDVKANEMKLVEVYGGHPVTYEARAAMATTGKVCYAVNSEQADTCALHVTATENISLFATNYKRATFDATNVLPTASLLDEYIIQSYSPSDHGGTAQGTHFAIVAVEDGTEVTYVPTEATTGHAKGETVKTETLKAGQVWYVWTGTGDGDPYDLSGTHIKSNKKIAVFQGCPHTNIPTKIKERDHLFSQAMPTKCWGNTFVLTASSGRKVDYVRILALNDGTEVRINGDSVYTFDFSKNPKQYWEFKIGANGDYAKTGSCIVKTSCPCATHLFMASKQADGVTDGDPAMLWVNPIEQQIDQVTFATYSSQNGTTHHYVNVVTDKPEYMFWNGSSIQDQFKQVSGSQNYYYAQISLGSVAASHTLKSTKSNFIAHVYGFTENESYGYSAGGATKPLTQYITINGKIFTPDTENTLCGDDIIRFACHPDYEYNKIEWYFGDGQNDLSNKDSVLHEYTEPGTYFAYVLIYRESSNLCAGQNAVDSIPIRVTIGNYELDIKGIKLPYCTKEGDEADLTIDLYNPSQISLAGDSVSLAFDNAAIEDGFSPDKLEIANDSTLIIHLPGTAKGGKPYGLHLRIGSECPNNVVDTIMGFRLIFDIPVLTQRYDNILGLLRDSFPTQELSNFVWHHNGEPISQKEQSSVLYLDETNPDNTGEYFLCFDIKYEDGSSMNYCTCPVTFKAEGKKHEFVPDADGLTIIANYLVSAGGMVYVNADYKGETDIECYAQWITANGKIYNDLRFDIPDGGCTIPAPKENGLYLLRVITGKGSRSFKFVINQ